MRTIDGIDVCVAECCMEWIMPMGIPWGKCGYCGQVPVFVRDDGPIPKYSDSHFEKYLEAA